MSLPSRRGLFVALFLGVMAASAARAGGPWTPEQAKTVLKEAEAIRSLDKAKLSVDLKTVESNRTTEYDLKILRSTERRAYIEFMAPEEERGRRMLAKGMQYWSTFPDSKKVVAISRREMIGNSAFALADIFQIDGEHDYDSTIVGEETFNGVPALKLELKGKDDDAPYARIEYWVEAKGYFPLKAKFYGVSGKHLKTMTVESRKEIAGRLRPEVTKMVDEATAGHVSWWHTKTMEAADVPDEVFSKDYLKSGGG